MRRTVTGVLLAAMVVAAGPGLAVAHPMATVSLIPVGRPATVNIIVPSESTAPMVGVDIHVPAGFRLDDAVEPQGWTVSRAPGTVQFRSAGVAHGASAYFALRGVAERKAVLKFPITTHASDGTTEQWGGGLSPAATVYAGYSDIPGQDATEEFDWRLVAGLTMVVVPVGVIVVMEVRRRRAPERPA